MTTKKTAGCKKHEWVSAANGACVCQVCGKRSTWERLYRAEYMQRQKSLIAIIRKREG